MTPRRMFSFATMMVSAQRRHAEKAGPTPRPDATPGARGLELVPVSKEPHRAGAAKAPPAPTPWLQLA